MEEHGFEPRKYDFKANSPWLLSPTAPISFLVGDCIAETSLLAKQVQTQGIASNLLIQFLYWNLAVINTAFQNYSYSFLVMKKIIQIYYI